MKRERGGKEGRKLYCTCRYRGGDGRGGEKKVHPLEVGKEGENGIHLQPIHRKKRGKGRGSMYNRSNTPLQLRSRRQVNRGGEKKKRKGGGGGKKITCLSISPLEGEKKGGETGGTDVEKFT